MAKELSMVFKCGKENGKCNRHHKCKRNERCDGHENPQWGGQCLKDNTIKICIKCNHYYYICPDLIMESE